MPQFINKHRAWFIILMSIAAFAAVIFFTATDNRLKITRYTVRSEEIPRSFDGATIIQLSDIHGEIPDEAADFLLENTPTALVLTGDTIDERTEDFDNILDLLSKAAERFPVFLVTGNHEQWLDDTENLIERIEKTGARVLGGKTAALALNGETIYISGIPDPAFMDDKLAESALMRQNKITAEKDGFNILLFHRADMLDCFDNSGYDLILSGHLHGGQIRVPLIGGVLSPNGKWLPDYSGGIYELNGGAVGISNRGLTNSTGLPRIYNRPEAVLITLRRK